MKVCVITATKGRHSQLERSVRFFLDQDYVDCIQLIYNNSCEPQRLNSNLDTSRFVVVNNCLDNETGKHYTNLGAIYRDAVKYIPEDVDIVSFWDDDDVFYPDHISEGVKGYEKALGMGKLAYKPKYSYYRLSTQLSLVENTMEPSIFVNKEHLLRCGFLMETTAQHLGWVNPLVYDQKIWVDIDGKPTLIYNWGDDISTFKTSGDPHNPHNFENYASFSKDHGDGIITPWAKNAINKYFAIQPT